MRGRGRDVFTTVRVEGQILPPDLLARISGNASDIGGLRREDYHLSGETINEATSRSWNRLLGAWKAFKERRENLLETEPETAMTRERWLLPLFRELDYGRLQTSRAVEIEGKSYPVSHVWEDTPIHLAGYRADLDRRTVGRAGAARMSPHSLVQELLNRSDEYLWAFVSNGLRLRVLRDNASLTRQAYVEFDLEAMMDGEVYPDFVLLWMLCHQSRVEVAEGERPEECRLEKWSQAAAEQGSRALDRLRDGVEAAIRTLGSGFLGRGDNAELRRRLTGGELHVQDYYRQLLRLVYRMLFLFVAEDRGLLLDPDADEKARDRYARFYSTRKLRDHAAKRIGGRHADLYRQLSLVVRMLGEDDGCPPLGLPALGGFLFDEGAAPDLARADIANRDLLDAVRALAYVDQGAGLTPVDYKNLGAEELGSVYESLLELSPVLDSDAGAFALEVVSGNERKTTGSYYTPDSLVTSLLDTALDPVLEEAARKPNAERAILDLKVCDPAVGSGHFLIRAAHRIARRLAAVRTGDDEPAPEPHREALRAVIGRCLYGVDVNPMSAELCRFNLLLEGLAPGKPLSFLEGHIKVGNSLLGTMPDLIRDGIPDDAFKPIEGDDKQTVSLYKKRNKAEREAWESGQTALDLRGYDEEGERLRRGYELFEAAPDDTPGEVREKEARYRAVEGSGEMAHRRLVADAWCAAFVWPKSAGVGSRESGKRGPLPAPITTATLHRLTEDPTAAGRATVAETRRLATDYGFFHWHTAFPNVFGENVEEPGFDVVLGNPPWERIKLQEQEWFAARSPEIATAPNAAARKRKIKALVEEAPDLSAAFLADLRRAEGASHLIRASGRFPLCGRGDVNTYSIFAETKRDIISATGRVGCIVPSGIATDNTTKDFFADLVNTKTLASLYSFENEELIFPTVHHATKFCLLTLSGFKRSQQEADFVFFARQTTHLKQTNRHFTLSASDFALLNPNTRTCPIFRSKLDAELTKTIYRRVPVFMHDSKSKVAGNPWEIKFATMFHMSNDSSLFRTHEEMKEKGYELAKLGNNFALEQTACRVDERRYVPLYEAKMMYHFDHRFGTYQGQTEAQANQGKLPELTDQQHADPGLLVWPRYWVPASELQDRLRDKGNRQWLLGWRNITSAVTTRTIIASILPWVGVGHSCPLMFVSLEDATRPSSLLANLTSFVLDYCVRQKLGGNNLTYGYLKQLPVLPPETYDAPVAWEGGGTLSDWISSRVLELTYTAHDLAPFARDLGYEGDPFPWDPERRFRLRSELDAAYFHLYGIVREDVEYIMETFPIVKRKDEAAHGEYRTKRVIVEIFDEMAAAIPDHETQAAADIQPEPKPAPATIIRLHPPREDHRQTEPPAALAAEPPADYETFAAEQKRADTPEDEPRTGSVARAPENAILEGEDSLNLPPERQEDEAGHTGQPAEKEKPKSDGDPATSQPNLYETALVLHACIPHGGRVPREDLFADAAREMGHKKVNRKVRRSLNKALRAEMSAGRLETDWEEVWKPKRKKI